MPLPLAANEPDALTPLCPRMSRYPAVTRQASGAVDGVLTVVTTMQFADKIMITITQGGCLAQWVHVPLDLSSPIFANEQLSASTQEDALLPMKHLTPRVLLGASNPERETVGSLYATRIASAIITKNPQEIRTVMVGLGLTKFEVQRQAFFDIVDLVMSCL